MTEKRKAFAEIEIPHRPGKPRESGLTMLIDWGMGLDVQADCLEIGAEYIDLAKIAVGVSRLLPASLLRRKLDLYREYDVIPFPGGQFLEYSVHFGQTEAYLTAARDMGYQWIEVSDNVLEIGLEEKADLIRLAREPFGLNVIGESGSKVTSSSAEALITDVQTCLEAGAWKVFVEAAELFDRELNTELVESITDAVALDDLIFEVPGPWIPEVRRCDQHTLRAWLIRRFGPLVNLGNVAVEDVVSLETMRRGIGVAALRG